MIYRCPFQLLCIFCTNRAVMQQLQTLIDYMPRSQYGLLKTRHMSHFELQAHYCIHCIVQHSLGGPLVQGICNTKVHHGVIKQSAKGWACTSFDSTTLSLEVRSSDMQRVDPAHVQHLAFFEYVICNTWWKYRIGQVVDCTSKTRQPVLVGKFLEESSAPVSYTKVHFGLWYLVVTKERKPTNLLET